MPNPEIMIAELLERRLEVCLIPAPEPRHHGHFIRACSEANADWYRRFCKKYLSSRKDQNRKGRTLIKRQCTIEALEVIIKETRRHGLHVLRFKRGIYVNRLLDFIELENRNESFQAQPFTYDAAEPAYRNF